MEENKNTGKTAKTNGNPNKPGTAGKVQETIETAGSPPVKASIAGRLKQVAEIKGHRRAVVYPAGWDENGLVAYTHLTFLQLDEESDRMAHALVKAGIRKGMRTVLYMKPSLLLYELAFALFKIGAVLVYTDPDMEKNHILSCIRESRAEAVIGHSGIHLLKTFHKSHFKTVKHYVNPGKKWLFPGVSLEQVYPEKSKPFPCAETSADDPCAISFSRGAEEMFRGTVITHGSLETLMKSMKTQFRFRGDDLDMATLPFFFLLGPVLGITTVIPNMDVSQPGSADPERCTETFLNLGVTSLIASPALVNRISHFAKEKGIVLLSLKKVIVQGAPLSVAEIGRIRQILPEIAELYCMYGTADIPCAIVINTDEIISETAKFTDQGFGICLGRPVEGIRAEIISLRNEPIEKWEESLLLPDGDMGEIVLTGPLAGQHFFEKPEIDKLLKIKDNTSLWHRTGDMGWRDNKGRIWFCGRKDHRVFTENRDLFPVPCESVFKTHPAVLRCALLGEGVPPKQKPVMLVQLEPGAKSVNQDQLRRELLQIAGKNIMTREIKTIRIVKDIPVDDFHRTKIRRELIQISE